MSVWLSLQSKPGLPETTKFLCLARFKVQSATLAPDIALGQTISDARFSQVCLYGHYRRGDAASLLNSTAGYRKFGFTLDWASGYLRLCLFGCFTYSNILCIRIDLQHANRSSSNSATQAFCFRKSRQLCHDWRNFRIAGRAHSPSFCRCDRWVLDRHSRCFGWRGDRSLLEPIARTSRPLTPTVPSHPPSQQVRSPPPVHQPGASDPHQPHPHYPTKSRLAPPRPAL